MLGFAFVQGEHDIFRSQRVQQVVLAVARSNDWLLALVDVLVLCAAAGMWLWLAPVA